ncbi:DUF4031 domain-containing protein [Streptomyces sp. NPDC052396]|uniref:DUF4031 domain-containing protein n=1 Tax=Streptomyces sp. NPDC052396 TaxID=3365689 RepID=UPI0037D6EA1A
MALYIDPPVWPGHGRMWSHLISDQSFEELHAFAARLGAPARAFDRDHYDVPADAYPDAVRLGAVEAGSRELVRLLRQAGLRRPKRGPGRVPGGVPDGAAEHPHGG